MTKHRLYIGLGSNLGNRKALIWEALRLVDLCVGHVERISPFYETAPWGFQSEHPFLNAAARVTTCLSPYECLAVTQHIERQLGRTRKSVDGQYHDRTIDIDLLRYDDLHIQTEKLTLPHPLIEEREFVKRPLNDLLG